MLLVDPSGATLLFRGHDATRPELGTWWFTPGGGLDPGESTEQAARREVREETGLELADLGAPVGTRVAEFEFEGVAYRQAETYYRAVVPRFDPSSAGWSDVERRSLAGWRWWAPAELAVTPEVVHPDTLLVLLTA